MQKENPYLIFTDIYNTPGTAVEILESFSKQPETAKILKAQIYSLQGRLDEIDDDVKSFLLSGVHEGFYETISAGTLLAKCAIWKGDINLWRKARQHIYEAPCKDDTQRQILSCWLAINDSAMSDIREYPEWFKIGNFECLPADSYSSARVYYVKYLFVAAFELASGKVKYPNVEGLGLMRALPYIIEPMISQSKLERTFVPEIYLRLMAATAYHVIGDEERAVLHIDKAILLSLPDKLYCPLADFCTSLGSIFDDRMANIDRDLPKKVKDVQGKLYSGWVKLHNQLLERNVSNTLTMREREVARLAAFGYSNKEIAKRLHIEVSSVKSFVFTAMNKVGALKRTELGLYI